MKGIIFNLLEDFLRERLGEEGFEELIDGCNLITTEPFVGPGSYPDEDLIAIVDGAVAVTGVTKRETLRTFGRFCIGKLAARYPFFFSPHDGAKSFLSTVNSIHFVEIKKLYAEAVPPELAIEDPGDNRLIIKYSSRRMLCHFVEGLLEGIGERFGSRVCISQSECMLEGGRSCVFELEFVPSESIIG
jgi:hypothetical protein